MSFFRDASIEYQGAIVSFSAEEGRAQELPGNYWHGPGLPSTWLAVAVFCAAQRKMRGAPDSMVLTLAAAALDMSVGKLIDLIRWNENYMRWHDGDDSYRVLSDT